LIVTEIIKGGSNTATLQVNALVCQNCGERFYHEDTIRKFENIKLKLERLMHVGSLLFVFAILISYRTYQCHEVEYE
jgi:YgiT-type zinc finger domain-containing protein